MVRPIFLSLLLFSCTETQLLQDGGTDVGATDARADSGAALDAKADDAEPMDADPIDADPVDADPMDADPIDADPTDAEPTDGPRDCAQIEAEYQALVSQTTCDNGNCQVLLGHCAVGLGGCWYTVNSTVAQAQLDVLADEYATLLCTSGVCRCTAPPAGAMCEQNMCVPTP